MRKLLFLLTLAGVFLAGCQKKPVVEPGTPEDPVTPPAQIPIRLSMGITSRATDTAFDNGDAVGLYVVSRADGATLKDSGNHVDNLSFTYDGSQWKATREVYWKDQQSQADFYCYYPFRNTIAQVKSVPVEVSTQQTTDAGYRSGDILWGTRTNVAPTSEPVQIQVRHLMSNLLVYLEPGNGYDAAQLREDLQSIRICGTRTHGSLDLSTGVITATGDPAEIVPLLEDDHYRALIVPQTLSSTALVSLQVAGSTYTLNTTITFEPGKQHKCTLKVNKTSEGIDIGIIGWENDDTDYGGTVN